MHAYLFIGSELSNLNAGISNLAIEYPIVKIGDTRDLNDLIKLSFGEPTLIVCPNIHQSGEEALNAFLKNLEEPQKNIYFALTAVSVRKILPTIVSRCQIVKMTNDKSQIINENIEEIEDFLKMTPGARLSYIDKIKIREEAIEFAENMVLFMHRSLHDNEVKYDIDIENIKLALETLTRLKANGNVNLQLSNFVINYN
jgi:DNA polymerase III delta prime subunit